MAREGFDTFCRLTSTRRHVSPHCCGLRQSGRSFHTGLAAQRYWQPGCSVAPGRRGPDRRRDLTIAPETSRLALTNHLRDPRRRRSFF